MLNQSQKLHKFPPKARPSIPPIAAARPSTWAPHRRRRSAPGSSAWPAPARGVAPAARLGDGLGDQFRKNGDTFRHESLIYMSIRNVSEY